MILMLIQTTKEMTLSLSSLCFLQRRWSCIHTGDFLHQSLPILGFSNLSDLVLSQQLLQFNYLQFKSTYKTGSITASLLLLTSLFYYHVVAYKQITADFMTYDQFIKTLLQRSVEL